MASLPCSISEGAPKLCSVVGATLSLRSMMGTGASGGFTVAA
jgi:hypothetical protein